LVERIYDKDLFEKYGIYTLYLNEEIVEHYFKQHFKDFGFSHIQPLLEKDSVGDYLALENGKWVHVELEVFASSFFTHPAYIRKEIEVIVCYKKGKSRDKNKQAELEQKRVIEIWNFLNLAGIYVYRNSMEKLFLEANINHQRGK